MAERPAIYRVIRLGDAAALGLVAIALRDRDRDRGSNRGAQRG